MGSRFGSAASKNLPAYGAWNADKVVQGTGETLPDPAATSRRGSQRPYKRAPRSRSAVCEGVGGGRSTDDGRAAQPGRKDPYFVHASYEQVRAVKGR
jgi:hypothetical protein